MAERLARAWLALAALLLVLSLSQPLLGRAEPLTDHFFRVQDVPVLMAVIAAAAATLVSPAVRSAALGFSWPVATSALIARGRPWWLAAAVLVLAGAGVFLVCDAYPLSMDEFMATFDAKILAHGRLLAPVPAALRPLSGALQTMFMLPVPGGGLWSSAYLPMNAGLLAAAGKLGLGHLLEPLLAAASVLLLPPIARRLAPEQPGAGVIAAILLATSSQVLVTGMTPYAMTAHMALNLVWLLAFLRGGRLGHGAALVVAFLACGLHQLVFHPLFAAPFVLQLWIERRWSAALLYSLAYAAICLFWTFYFPVALTLSGAPPSVALGAAWLARRTQDLVADFGPENLALMGKNLIRFVTWQDLLTAPLAALALPAALRAGGPLRSLALGVLLTLSAVFVILPYQGHGWGYRYLAGEIGPLCLLAAFQWSRMTEALPPERRAAAVGVLGLVAAASLLVFFPLRCWQAHRFLSPYARAYAAIARAPTTTAVVDARGVWFGQDLVRNDPYLRNRPLIFDLGVLAPAQVASLCARGPVTLFDRSDATRYGIATFGPPPSVDATGSIQALAACPQVRRVS